MCGSSAILFYFGRVLCLVWLALPFSILKGSKPTYFDIVFFSTSPNDILRSFLRSLCGRFYLIRVCLLSVVVIVVCLH